ncbi:putative transcriptional regulator [Paenibacillus sp. 4624]|uniref:helix-turn-helix domain-containing protein n=1 Tax=Paenibacillus sp. 4624 TaxID=3156453 RepID=UPI003D20E9BF
MIGSDGISIAQKLTLKEARENFGYKIEEVAEKSGISAARILELEVDASQAFVDEFVKLCTFYGTDRCHIYSGVAENVLGARKETWNIKTPAVTSDQHTELMAYWEMKKQLLDLIFTISNEENYTQDRINNDLAQILAIVDVREKEAMSAITAAYTASVSHLR